jgi:Ca-activated chloride channel family protein
MRFAEPHWLLAGLVVLPLLALLLVRSERLRSRALALLEGARLRTGPATSGLRRWLRVVVCTLAVAMGFLALARPQKGMHWETAVRKGTDLLLVVDTSRSMDADDVKPTRLERAKLAIHDLVERFPGDRIGLVAFAGDAFVQSPMTLDHDALIESVNALDTSVIARGGTNVGRGIDVATDALATEPGQQKIMVLLTDGEDLEGQGLVEARRASSAGITIDTVGVGTLAGELVPAKDGRGVTIGVARDEAGSPVRSRLDEAGLRAIAAAAHGSYRPLGPDGRGLDRLYDESLAGLTRVDASSRTHRVYSEWFEIPLGLALFGLVLDVLLGRRWRRRGATSRRWRGAAPAMAAAAAGLLLLAIPSRARASVGDAAKAYASGHFDEAAKRFEAESARKPKDARLAFNAGDAAYRAGHFDSADAAFKRAVVAADPKLQQQVLYNDGDVLYRLGESRKPEEREQTVADWKAAIKAYDGAIALDAKDGDARFNRDFVKRKLDELEQKPKDEPKKDEPKNGDSSSKKDDKSGGGAGDKEKKDAKGGGGGKDKGADSTGGNDPKGGASGSKPTPGSSGPGNQSKPAETPGGSSQGEGGKPGAPPAAAPMGPTPGPAGGTPPGEGGEGSESHKAEGKDARPGGLSARDARALVGALRGEERRGVSHGTDAGEASDDAPRKDW